MFHYTKILQSKMSFKVFAHRMIGRRSVFNINEEMNRVSIIRPLLGRNVSTNTTETLKNKALSQKDGKIVLYCGPPAMKTWLYYLVGGTFALVGFEVAHNIYYHFNWPLFSKDPNRKPELVSERARTIGAFIVGSIGIVTGSLFFMVPSSTVTRLTLDLPNRHLIIRTAIRGFSALPPRAIYPSALRRTAELRGYYLTPNNNERVVPLASVYRVRGSALSSSASSRGVGSPSITIRKKGAKQGEQSFEDLTQYLKRSIEIKVGNGRFWYTIEAGGHGSPDVAGQKGTSSYLRFWQRLSYSMRGTTDWSGLSQSEREALLAADESLTSNALNGDTSKATHRIDPKQPVFSDRQTFDDVIPLVKRK